MIAFVCAFIGKIKGKDCMNCGVKVCSRGRSFLFVLKESDECLLSQGDFQLHRRLASLLSWTISRSRQVELIRIISPESSSYPKSSSSLLIHNERQ